LALADLIEGVLAMSAEMASEFMIADASDGTDK
jgi:hypothetical protein